MSTLQCASMKNFDSSLKLEEEVINIEKQGIVSILGSDSDQTRIKAAASIRRTLSADMSSKKWLSKNGLFSPMKKIASSDELVLISSAVVIESDSSSSDGELEEEKLNEDQSKTFDWSSILSKKNNEDSSNNLPPPYIHPLDKNSSSSLSEKSLEICTESLGSETGSDCFSSSPSSEKGDLDDDKDAHHLQQQQQQQQQQPQHSFEDFHVVKYSNTKRISSPKSFPPPLPSVHMQSRRQDGRLILEAVSVPPKNFFHAQRLDGRLLLTYFDQNNDSKLGMENHDDKVEELKQVFDDIQEVEGNEIPLSDNGGDNYEDESEEEDDEEEKEKEDVERKGMCIVMEQSPRLSSEVIVLFENSTLVPRPFNNSLNSRMEVEQGSIVRECYTCPSVPQSLLSPSKVAQVIPTAPPPAAAASFNAYDYFWRKKPIVDNPTIDDQGRKKDYYSNKQVFLTAANGTDPKATITNKKAAYEQKDLVAIRGNKASTNNMVPLLRSCKEPRRSLIIWEPYCIATS